jgi:hypothetical protein
LEDPLLSKENNEADPCSEQHGSKGIKEAEDASKEGQ